MIRRVLERGASRRKGRAQPQHLVERDKAEDIKFKKVLERKPQGQGDESGLYFVGKKYRLP